MFFELSVHELNVLHSFLTNSIKTGLQPSSALTLARNSMFLNEMPASKKQSWIFWIKEQDILCYSPCPHHFFWNPRACHHLRDYCGALVTSLRYASIITQTRAPSILGIQTHLHVSKAEYGLLYRRLKEATQPPYQFSLDATGISRSATASACHLPMWSSTASSLANGEEVYHATAISELAQNYEGGKVNTMVL